MTTPVSVPSSPQMLAASRPEPKPKPNRLRPPSSPVSSPGRSPLPTFDSFTEETQRTSGRALTSGDDEGTPRQREHMAQSRSKKACSLTETPSTSSLGGIPALDVVPDGSTTGIEDSAFLPDISTPPSSGTERMATRRSLRESRSRELLGQTKGNIIYRLSCKDLAHDKKEIIRYQWEPFEGLEQDRQERQELAPIDVMNAIIGYDLTRRPSQRRETFETRQDKDPRPYVIGKDFQYRGLASAAVRIFSPSLRKVLRDIILYYPGQDLEAEEVSILSPYKILFHYWESLQLIAKAMDAGRSDVDIENPETGSKVTVGFSGVLRADLSTLMTAPPIEKVFSQMVSPEIKLHMQGRATYNYLWLLFRPGDIVLAKTRDKQAGYVLESCHHEGSSASRPESSNSTSDHWKIKAWNLSYEEDKLVRHSNVFTIPRYKGEKEFGELSIIPIRVLPHHDDVKEALILRGRRYYKMICNEPSHLRYQGHFSSDKLSYYKGEIIIDHKTFLTAGIKNSKTEKLKPSDKEPKDFGGGPLFSKFNDMRCSVDTPLEDAQYLLLPHEVNGFALEKKTWGIFDMDFVQELDQDTDPMEHLVIKDETRDLILASAGLPRLGMTLEPWSSIWAADFIEGKGNGRVVLLHGPPGTGKTMTVECVAKWTKQPLLPLSAADLGTDDSTVQSRLAHWLDLASQWGAIVILDEAEVYLEQRQAGEISRNALVAAFLRSMEYFPGLMFLTTNGIGLFDEAVMSRIHLAIQYDRVDQGQRAQIWASLFRKLDEDQKTGNAVNAHQAQIRKSSIVASLGRAKNAQSPHLIITGDAQSLALGGEYKDLELNGRDIRNVLLSAISLATRDAYKKPGAVTEGADPATIVVEKSHLELVLKKKKGIRESYKLARGGYPEEIAAQRYSRGISVGE